jgi:hypothetical protein
LVGIIYRVEEISESGRALAAIARAIQASDTWTGADVVHTLTVLSVENAGHSGQQQALLTENEQLRRAVETRDTGRPKAC